MMIHFCSMAVALVLIGTGAQAQAAMPSPCASIYEVYNACEKNFSVQDSTFIFPIKNSQVSVSCQDGLNLSFYQRMEHMDVISILSLNYTPGLVPLPVSSRNEDPGRLRLEPLLLATYGDNEAEVRKNLVAVDFLGQKVRFNRKNGAAAALRAVSDELLLEIRTDEVLRAYLTPWLVGRLPLSGATMDWRNIAGTNLLSAHSFGTAIDLFNTEIPGPVYWFWEAVRDRQHELAKQGTYIPYEKLLKTTKETDYSHFQTRPFVKVPEQLIHIFEKNGFIWGGKWFHFDPMHFEYRPEFFPHYKMNCAGF